MDKHLHHAVQYLAAAAGSYIEHQSDDSHANLDWNKERTAFVTRALDNKGLQLAINTQSYSIEFWNAEDKTISGLGLENSSHQEIIQWIEDFAKLKGIEKAFKWAFNYELPDHAQTDFVFPKSELKEVERLNTLRNVAADAMSTGTAGLEGVSEQRIWPHHFDLGLLINKSGGAEGNSNAYYVGLAIPDGLVNDHYLYVNPWIEGADLDLGNMPNLNKGKWLNGDWKGSVIEASGLSQEEATSFLKASFDSMDSLF